MNSLPAESAEMAGWLSQNTYAHRGLHGLGRPENSMAAFSAAIERGLGIECDVRLSREGRVMVFHDAELSRLTGQQGRLRDKTVAQLTALRLLGGEDQTIPTLRDLLDEVAGRVPLLLEIKSDKEHSPLALCRAVRADLEGYQGPAAVMSFDPRVSAWFARRDPAVPRGLVVTEENNRALMGTIKRWLAFRQSRAQFLAYDIRDLPSRFAASKQATGIPLLTWTVRSAQHWDTANACSAAPIAEGPVLENRQADA